MKPTVSAADLEARRMEGVPRGAPPSAAGRVIVVDLEVPFWSMVVLMVKWSIAAIPALLILLLIGSVAAGFLGAIVSSLGTG